MDQELEYLFQKSETGPTIPKFTLPTEQKEELETDNVDATNTKDPSKLSRREKKKLKQEPQEKLDRTLFIGNVPNICATDRRSRNDLLKLFSQFGTVESLRFRNIITQAHVSKKIAYRTGKIDPDSGSINVYVVMNNADSMDNITQNLNMTLFKDHHLRVDRALPKTKEAVSQPKWDTRKSIFVGNLPLKIKDEQVYNHFSSCGNITNIRIIRDFRTGLTKGFAYVTFGDKSSLDLAVQLNGIELEKRPLRISKCAKAEYIKKKKLNNALGIGRHSKRSFGSKKNDKKRKTFTASKEKRFTKSFDKDTKSRDKTLQTKEKSFKKSFDKEKSFKKSFKNDNQNDKKSNTKRKENNSSTTNKESKKRTSKKIDKNIKTKKH